MVVDDVLSGCWRKAVIIRRWQGTAVDVMDVFAGKELVFKFVSIGAGAEEVEVKANQILPFNAEDLLNNNPTYKLKIDASSLTHSTKIDEAHTIYRETPSLVFNSKANVEADIEFHRIPTVLGLVNGGWLPLPFIPPSCFLVDRNVVSNLDQIKAGKEAPYVEDTKWWMSFFERPIMIDPVLYAFEGNSRKFPSYKEFYSSLYEVLDHIPSSLSSIKVMYYDDDLCRIIYAVLGDIAERNIQEQEFLIRACPKITNRVSSDRLAMVRDDILSLSSEFNLVPKSLVVLAVLSCLYEAQDGSGFLAARKVLKPSKRYDKKKAYNALSDLRLLYVYMFFLSLKRQPPPVLCTCDKGLAGFWSILNPQNVRLEGNAVRFDIDVHHGLFSRLEDNELQNIALLLN